MIVHANQNKFTKRPKHTRCASCGDLLPTNFQPDYCTQCLDFNKVWTLTPCSTCLSSEFTFDCSEHGDAKTDQLYSAYLAGLSSATGSLKYITNSFAWNVDERTLELELETLYLLDDVSVVRTGDASAGGTAGAAYGYVYSIYFDGARARALQTTLSASDRLLVEAGEGSFLPLVSGGTGNVLVSEIVAPNDVDTLTSTTIPLARRDAPAKKAYFLAAHVKVASPLQIFRVSGQRWQVSMDSLVGNRAAMAIVASRGIGFRSAAESGSPARHASSPRGSPARPTSVRLTNPFSSRPVTDEKEVTSPSPEACRKTLV